MREDDIKESSSRRKKIKRKEDRGREKKKARVEIQKQCESARAERIHRNGRGTVTIQYRIRAHWRGDDDTCR